MFEFLVQFVFIVFEQFLLVIELFLFVEFFFVELVLLVEFFLFFE